MHILNTDEQTTAKSNKKRNSDFRIDRNGASASITTKPKLNYAKRGIWDYNKELGACSSVSRFKGSYFSDNLFFVCLKLFVLFIGFEISK